MEVYGLDPVMLGLVMVVIGVALVFIGIVAELLRSVRRSAKVKVGGAVLIGPFPIIFGDRELVKYSLILLLVLVVLTIMFMVIPGVLR
ncbi:TIGR00304 family protein [Candidatus Bathyarchaeota archaeon]|nr:MAG: TIGR00304 family protein [Candidatus Bathyarchaeota archaeon]